MPQEQMTLWPNILIPKPPTRGTPKPKRRINAREHLALGALTMRTDR
jgi:hypothetical protein